MHFSSMKKLKSLNLYKIRHRAPGFSRYAVEVNFVSHFISPSLCFDLTKSIHYLTCLHTTKKYTFDGLRVHCRVHTQTFTPTLTSRGHLSPVNLNACCWIEGEEAMGETDVDPFWVGFEPRTFSLLFTNLLCSPSTDWKIELWSWARACAAFWPFPCF